jgi:peptidoglycan/xylan/chitin deacetylase (PgdA/CDA1 family)
MATDATFSPVEIFYGHSIQTEEPRPSIGPVAANAVSAAALERFLRGRLDRCALRWNDLLQPAERRPDRSAGAFLLTLDDGYRDNLTNALPILERLEIPVVVFVTTGFVDGSRAPAEEALARIIAGCTWLHLPDGGTLPCASLTEMQAAYGALKPRLKKGSLVRRRRLLDSLASLNGIDLTPGESPFLTWDEVCQLDQHPLVTIGAHTRSHPLLTALSPFEAYAEIRDSKSELEGRLGHRIDCFAYPYGGENWIVRRLAAKAGFRLAFATKGRPFDLRGRWYPYRIPRMDLKGAIGAAAGSVGRAA